MPNPEEILTVALVDDTHTTGTPAGNAIRRIIVALQESGTRIEEIGSNDDARTVLASLPETDCIIISWDLGGDTQERHKATAALIHDIRSLNEDIPVFLMGEPGKESPAALTIDMIREATEYVWVMEDAPESVAGRVTAAAKRYRDSLLPPFFGPLVTFSKDFEHSWHTPGHTGGTAFRKSPPGRIFYDFFGEQLFRSDLSISVTELGSLLDHSGPVGDAEKYAATVFGADRTYFVTNGTSTANKIVFSGTVTDGEIVLVDRNCHKSIEHAVTMTHTLPVFLLPTRNRYGIIGPIHPDEMQPATVAGKIAGCPLTRTGNTKEPALAVVTNSTYDGLCYDAARVEELLGNSTGRILFDEAWFAFARFNPLYRGRFAMREDTKKLAGPTVFATQSTHKLLAALSQASMVHVRTGRSPFEHGRFNEAFMMHTSTSPLYPVIASLDVSSKMMDGQSGINLTTECIDEAIRFRKIMAKTAREIVQGKGKRDWWFGIWQPDTVHDPRTGKTVPFADARHDLLRDEPSSWVLHPGDAWHGFDGLEDGYCMLDPIRVTVLTPGVAPDGSLETWGIPASIVAKFLETRGIISEKNGDYTLLFLFSMGITRGKWGTLLSELFEFKRHYDGNSPLEETLPDLVKQYPDRYRGMTIKGLVAEMHAFMRENQQGILLERAFSLLPEPRMTFADAYRHLVKGNVEEVPVAEMGDRTVATGVVPYPPGIPLLLPGEWTGKSDGPVLRYLLALQNFDNRFPGFAHDIHGVRIANGEYRVYCIRGEL